MPAFPRTFLLLFMADLRVARASFAPAAQGRRRRLGTAASEGFPSRESGKHHSITYQPRREFSATDSADFADWESGHQFIPQPNKIRAIRAIRS